ncbi:hypothetical protein ACPW96_21470 [Micromonospora sp. DT81.3]|uniref:hypothetical protein n=1 Tax=Micromonospora sp. DT81.3 TaxID=3416523 RepID=UPI003CF9987C
MARFEQLVVSNRSDRWGIPRATETIIVNLDTISTVTDRTVDTTYQSFFSPDCPVGIYAAVGVTVQNGGEHTLLLGQFDQVDEADAAVDRFTTWLTGKPLLA